MATQQRRNQGPLLKYASKRRVAIFDSTDAPPYLHYYIMLQLERQSSKPAMTKAPTSSRHPRRRRKILFRRGQHPDAHTKDDSLPSSNTISVSTPMKRSQPSRTNTKALDRRAQTATQRGRRWNRFSSLSACAILIAKKEGGKIG